MAALTITNHTLSRSYTKHSCTSSSCEGKASLYSSSLFFTDKSHFSKFVSSQNNIKQKPRKSFYFRTIAETMATEKLGIKVERNPPETKLAELGVRKWPKWGCPPSKFPWTYDAKETCFLLKGKVKVIPDGHNDFVEFGAGDLVVFPKGMSCTWEVAEAVDKHYNFE